MRFVDNRELDGGLEIARTIDIKGGQYLVVYANISPMLSVTHKTLIFPKCSENNSISTKLGDAHLSCVVP